ncbi:hypothetical protein T09_5679 [Trichinella sp. T9]|nr:hypothetical protein T09_5679 [Trichinella sp. T9]
MGNISIHDIENAIHDVILDSNPNTLTTREVRIQLEKQFDENLHDKRVIIDEITMRMLVKKLKPIEELDVINEQKGIGLKNASTSESSDSSDDESSVVQCFNEDDYSDDSSDISIFDIFSEDEKEGNDAVPSSSNSNLSPPEQKNSELEDEMLARRLHLEELGCRQRSTKYYSHIKRCLVRSRDQALSSAKEKKTNKDLREIQSIAEVFKGKSNAQLIGMNIESAVCFKYAPVTSAESKMEDEIMQWTPAVRAEATESKRLIDGMCRTRLSEKEEKAAERIAKEESRKEKKKSKNKSKTKKSKKGETKVTVKQHMKKQTHQTENAVMKATTTTEITAAISDETVIVQPITDAKMPDEFIKEVQTIEKEDSKKIKKKSKKRTKSKKSKKTVEDTVDNKNVCSQMPETDIISPKLTLAGEITATDIDQPSTVEPIAEEKVEKPVIKNEPKGEKKDSKKIKKSKKRSKSKSSKKTVEDTVAKDVASSQMPKTDIKSPKRILPTET